MCIFAHDILTDINKIDYNCVIIHNYNPRA